MTYATVISSWLPFYVLGCAIGFIVNARDGDARAQVFTLGAVIILFDYFFHGQAKSWGYQWYFINLVADFLLMWSGYMFRFCAPSRAIFGLAAAACCLDLIYAIWSGFGHPLPGRFYFLFNNTVETLEVLSLTVLSSSARLAWNFILNRKTTRGDNPWHHRMTSKAG
jgi:multidrug transporter EmrE-like cation transporter